MTSKPTFLKWLKAHSDEDTPTGDLARDVMRDNRPCPKNYKKSWLDFLYEVQASTLAIEAFENAWNDYETL